VANSRPRLLTYEVRSMCATMAHGWHINNTIMAPSEYQRGATLAWHHEQIP
jgi:hypothetical protein